MEIIKELRFPNLQKGWEGINEYLFLNCEDIVTRGGGTYSTEFVSYNNYVIMDTAWVDPNFNFGKVLGYAKAKWSSLVDNYVNISYLDLIKNTIQGRHSNKANSYNYVFHFANKHGHGKDCLISLNFTKRVTQKKPVIVFNIRTSEVTKRLLFDFLLVQRIAEYVYGHNDVEVHLFAPSFYITAESFVMYNNVKSIKKLLKDYKPKVTIEYEGRKYAHDFQQKVISTYDKYMNHPDPHSVIYKVHRRSILQIRKNEHGEPESGVKDMFAKDLQLFIPHEYYPKQVVTKRAIKKYKTL